MIYQILLLNLFKSNVFFFSTSFFDEIKLHLECPKHTHLFVWEGHKTRMFV